MSGADPGMECVGEPADTTEIRRGHRYTCDGVNCALANIASCRLLVTPGRHIYCTQCCDDIDEHDTDASKAISVLVQERCLFLKWTACMPEYPSDPPIPFGCRKPGHAMSKYLTAALVSALAILAAGLTMTPAHTAETGSAATSSDPSATSRAIAIMAGVKPLRADASAFIKDALAVAQLGKAFFWDIQAGSDGQSCAGCHFHAGADIRTKNQVNPWLDEAGGVPDMPALPGMVPQSAAFSPRRGDGAAPTGPNAELAAADFPFKAYADPSDRLSKVLYETNDRFASAGTFAGDFARATNPAGPTDERCGQTYDQDSSPFHKDGSIMRRVTSRNAPSSINSIFNYRQFWDGRANTEFNGVNTLGPRDAGARIWVDDNGTQVWRAISIPNASAASQAVGPALSTNEMSCTDRSFADIARKLLPLRVLGRQKVHEKDSLFGLNAGLVNSNGPGLAGKTYQDLIQQAFQDQYHRAGTAQMQSNFALFWGIAIMEYEALLISDQSQFDLGALSQQQQAGRDIFTGKGNCSSCHSGPLFSRAAVTSTDAVATKTVDYMGVGDGTTAFYDIGFYNTGVRPSREDRGLGGLDQLGYDLSFSRQYIQRQKGAAPLDQFAVDACGFTLPFGGSDCTTGPNLANVPAALLPRDAVDGAFKTPILRNVALTPPYFHNGGQATLEQVVEFYNRGGDRQDYADGSDSTGTGDLPVLGASAIPDRSNIDVHVGDAKDRSRGLGLTADEQAALVAFLKSLTDDRVACHSGPFDHPELPLSMGHPDGVHGGFNGTRARDIIATLPATGRDGLAAVRDASGAPLPCFPNSGNLFGELQSTFKRILSPPSTTPPGDPPGNPPSDPPSDPPSNPPSNPPSSPPSSAPSGAPATTPGTGTSGGTSTGTSSGTAGRLAGGGAFALTQQQPAAIPSSSAPPPARAAAKSAPKSSPPPRPSPAPAPADVGPATTCNGPVETTTTVEVIDLPDGSQTTVTSLTMACASPSPASRPPATGCIDTTDRTASESVAGTAIAQVLIQCLPRARNSN